MPKTAAVTKAEQYVFARLATRTMWDALTAEERKEAEVISRWLKLEDDDSGTTPKRRGRPAGSRNKKAVNGAEAPPDVQGVGV